MGWVEVGRGGAGKILMEEERARAREKERESGTEPQFRLAVMDGINCDRFAGKGEKVDEEDYESRGWVEQPRASMWWVVAVVVVAFIRSGCFVSLGGPT
jgi:hypothetical protein